MLDVDSKLTYLQQIWCIFFSYIYEWKTVNYIMTASLNNFLDYFAYEEIFFSPHNFHPCYNEIQKINQWTNPKISVSSWRLVPYWFYNSWCNGTAFSEEPVPSALFLSFWSNSMTSSRGGSPGLRNTWSPILISYDSAWLNTNSFNCSQKKQFKKKKKYKLNFKS